MSVQKRSSPSRFTAHETVNNKNEEELVGWSMRFGFSQFGDLRRQQSAQAQAEKRHVTSRDNSRRVRRELEAVFAKRMEAVRNGDAEAQIAQLSRDYRATEPDGRTFNYEQIANYIRQGAKQIVSVTHLSITWYNPSEVSSSI